RSDEAELTAMTHTNAVFLFSAFPPPKTLAAIGGALIGLSLVGYGLWAAMTRRLDQSRLWIFFVAGFLVTVGPSAILWFIDLMTRS
ncbi:membrane protein, partial [Magnetospirillum fulvum MGU-K5]